MDKSNIKIFGLSASKELAKKVCDALGVKESVAMTSKFEDGELIVQSLDSVRGQEIYIIQSTNNPVNENLMELLIAIDAFKRASAAKINVVIPYFGYARQDRKARGRQPISARLVANLLETAGANRVIMVDIHSTQSMGFFNIPTDNFSTAQTVAEDIISKIIEKKLNPEECILVSPDHGGLTRVHNVGKYTGNIAKGIAVIAKRRPEPNKSEVEFILGEVKDKVCFVIDDMIDTAGTIINGAKALKEEGAKDIYLIACHGVFSGPAVERMKSAVQERVVKEVIITDTIEQPKEKLFEGLKIISVAGLLANMIKSSYEKHPLTDVYQEYQDSIVEKVEKYIKEII
ncbi:ribose-phosphate diphosphokinase [Spiroplasma tabanidicola]|uniref:ribose-phosphate diphosphokinase n=1 Tax=Spiroplasma tabanidicola TaxID=324079 RepID=A0A6I6CAF8_9MOLU|nr:ribose-phosphate pyrophosphokinase [Spiroplasma tabanidicola]QGS52449.1 ribose-phosphate pyrophosphokinase [Spiroplasma tabanidicola]